MLLFGHRKPGPGSAINKMYQKHCLCILSSKLLFLIRFLPVAGSYDSMEPWYRSQPSSPPRMSLPFVFSPANYYFLRGSCLWRGRRTQWSRGSGPSPPPRPGCTSCRRWPPRRVGTAAPPYTPRTPTGSAPHRTAPPMKGLSLTS